MNFSELGLTEALLRATKTLGYEVATPIQAKAIPVVLSGRDLIGCAQTGTGKTAAFTLPMLQGLLQSQPSRSPDQSDNNGQRSHSKGSRPKPRALRALILSPTRELAAQISESLRRYGQFTPLRETVVYGGVSQFHQVKALRHGVDALVATPGRLLDLMEQGYIDLSRVEVLVFDEADQMLDMGFLPALKRIVASVPKKRQTLMFSATMPDEIRRLAQQWLSNPTAIEVSPAATPVEQISQSVHLVDTKRKPDLLARLLKQELPTRTLVFSRTKHGADKIVKHLHKSGLHATAIHGNKSQNARSRALAQFKSSKPPVLVATDVAARGLDIKAVSHVVNYDLPEVPETYIHRIGRTARAGANGIAVAFCAGNERGLLKQIERLTKRTIVIEPTIQGFEPTDPVVPAPTFTRRSARGRSGGNQGNGYRGAVKYKAGSKPRPHGAKSEDGASTEKKSRRTNGSTNGPGKYKKSKRPGGATAGKRGRRYSSATS
jgi:ATP-dependent RNA helicase RhlE